MHEHYSPNDRDDVLRWLVTQSQSQQGFVGCILVGSGATGFADRFSDIDLVTVTEDALPLREISDRWRQHLLDHLPVLGCDTVPRAENVILHNFFLKNYLEINNSVLPLRLLVALRPNYKVMWDITGQMQRILDKSWNERKAVNPLDAYLRRVTSDIWHYIYHGFVSLRRGRPWQALSDIEEIRQQVIHLRGYREGHNPEHNRDVDCMSSDFRDQLSGLLVSSLVVEKMEVTLQAAARTFFLEAKAAFSHLGQPYGLAEVEAAMLELLAGESAPTTAKGQPNQALQSDGTGSPQHACCRGPTSPPSTRVSTAPSAAAERECWL